MKYLFGRDETGQIEFLGAISDEQSAPEGAYAAPESELAFVAPLDWMAGKVWDEVEGRPRDKTPDEVLDELKDAKEKEIRRDADLDFLQNSSVLESIWTVREERRLGVANLPAAERAIADSLFDKIQRLKSLVSQVRNAASPEEVATFHW